MKMAMKDGKIMLIEVDNTQMAIIKSWNSMKYDRRKNMMIGDCSKELLDNGKMMPVQVDSNEQIEREKRFNQHMDGIYKNQKLIYVAATDYGPMPKQGSLIQFDKRPYKVADAISEDGIYSITLEANRA